MADHARPARWRCPACGEALEPSTANGSDTIRLACPGCGGQFRVRRREGDRSSSFSGEVPVIRPAPPKVIGGFGLAWRRLILTGIVPAFHAGNAAGGLVMFTLGGFVPVVRGWMRDEVSGWSGFITALGGVSIARSASGYDDDTGVGLARSEAPELFHEITDVARLLRAKPPETVRLVYPPCCGVQTDRRTPGLLIGLPLLQVLSRAEFRAVLAHEMAHLARGDATAAARASRFVRGIRRALDAAPIPSRSPLRFWARTTWHLADRLHAPIAWGQEARADRAAASLGGGAVAASALVKVAVVQPLFRMAADAFDPTTDHRNFYEFFREFLDRLPETVWTEIRHGYLGRASSASDAAHPPLVDRLAAVQAYPERHVTREDTAPASTLLGDPGLFETLLHDRLFAIGSIEPSVFQKLRGRRRPAG